MRLRLHGLVLAVEGDGRLVEAARELVGGWPVEPGPTAPDMVLRLSPGAPSAGPAGEPLFFHGVVRCHADGQDLLVSDGASVARVVRGDGHIDVLVAEESLADGHRFAHVFLLIAVVLALRWRGLFHLHAGALVTPRGEGVLVAAGAGSGKSTLTVALIEQGCAYLGDDAVLLRGGPEGASVLAFPRPFHLTPASAAPFPHVSARLGTALPCGPKQRLDARQVWPGRERAEMGSPKLILLPTITGEATTTAEPVPAAEALRRAPGVERARHGRRAPR